MKGSGMITPLEIKKLYAKGENISALMRKELGVKQNTPRIIEVSYDMQSGSYIDAMKSEVMVAHKKAYTAEIARVISSLMTNPVSVLEAGVGEATTLAGVLGNLGTQVNGYGFDMSWSRVAYAETWLRGQGVDGAVLCTGDLLNIPFRDNSIDVVYTSHSIEPNGGSEDPILRELYRVARKFLILLEPDYDLANDEEKQRIDYHGYCKNLNGISRSLGYDVLKHEPFNFTTTPYNPTAITIISKQNNDSLPADVLACPKYKTPLMQIDGALYSPEALTAYPILRGIPCLRIENGIFASKLEEASDGRL